MQWEGVWYKVRYIKEGFGPRHFSVLLEIGNKRSSVWAGRHGLAEMTAPSYLELDQF